MKRSLFCILRIQENFISKQQQGNFVLPKIFLHEKTTTKISTTTTSKNQIEKNDIDLNEAFNEVVNATPKLLTLLEKKVEGLERQLKNKDQATKFQAMGEALVRSSNEKWFPGMKTTIVSDWDQCDENGNPGKMEVQLNPKKDLKQNAQDYFLKAKKILMAWDTVLPLLSEVKEEQKQWEKKLSFIEGISNLITPKKNDQELVIQTLQPHKSELLKIYSNLLSKGLIKQNIEKEKSKEVPSRKAQLEKKYGPNVNEYTSPSGIKVLAGRTAPANERVSFSLSKPHYLWFHAADGIGGSHVLLTCSEDEAKDEDIIFTAKICAYFSQARSSSKVNVMYCKASQVRHPPKSVRKVGLVHVIGNHKYVCVVPSIPDT